MNQLTAYQQCESFVIGLENDFNSLVSEYENAITFKKESLFALQHLKNNDYLVKCAHNDVTAFKSAILNIAAIGLTLNPAEKKGYLVPRNGKVCLDISYIGLSDIAVASGMIQFTQAKIVYEKDTFEYRGTSQEPAHTFNAFGDRGDIVGAYCVAKDCNGNFHTETMTIKELCEIRDRSEAYKRSKKGPWVTDFTEMAKKTVLKRGYKLWPKNNKSRNLDLAIDALNQHEGIDFKAEQEEKDKTAKEAYEAKLKEGQDAIDKKYQLIDEIKSLSEQINKGKELAEKASFMVKILQVKKFDELVRKDISRLEQTVENLRDMVE